MAKRDKSPSDSTRRLVKDLLSAASLAVEVHEDRSAFETRDVRKTLMENCARWGADYLWVNKHYRQKLTHLRLLLGESVDEFLAKEETLGWAVIEDALHDLATWKFYTGAPLFDAEHMLMNAREMIAQVNNGGLWQYFYNECGDGWRHMVRLLEEGGDEISKQRFLNCLSIFPEGRPSSDWDERRQQLHVLEETAPKRMQSHFARHTDIWYGAPYPAPQSLRTVLLQRRAELQPLWWNERDFSS